MAIRTPDAKRLPLESIECTIRTKANTSSPKPGDKRKREAWAITDGTLPSSPRMTSIRLPSTKKARSLKSPKLSKVSTKPSVPPFRVTKPEPSSINDIIRRNHRSRLYTKPLFWTSQHLELLQCHFRIEPECREDLKSSIFKAYNNVSQEDSAFTSDERKMIERSWQRVIDAHEDFYDYEVPRPSIAAVVANIFRAFGVRKFTCEFTIPFHFDGEWVGNLKVDALFSHPTYGTLIPAIAYIRFDQIFTRRQLSLYPSRHRTRDDEAIARIHELKQGQINPANQLEDPYIVVVLIALAQGLRRNAHLHGQAECYNSRYDFEALVKAKVLPWQAEETPSVSFLDEESKRKQEESPSYRVYAVAYASSSAMDRRLYLYKANISAKFLDKFDNPSTFSDAGDLVISYSRLPAETPEALASVVENKIFYPAS